MKRECDVLETRQAGQEIEKLKDEAELVSSHLREPVIWQPVEPLPVERDRAGGRPIEAADEVEQRRFSGSGRPDDRHQLPLRDVKIDAVERGDAAPPAEMLGDLFEKNH